MVELRLVKIIPKYIQKYKSYNTINYKITIKRRFKIMQNQNIELSLKFSEWERIDGTSR
jgi:hypothetical protein